MTPAELLSALRGRGALLAVSDGELQIVAGAEPVPVAILDQAATCSAELIAALEAEAAAQMVVDDRDMRCQHPHVVISNGVLECQRCDMRRRVRPAEEAEAPVPEGGHGVRAVLEAETYDQLVADGRDIIAALADRGITVRLAEDGRPWAGPTELIDEADMALLAAHREAVLAALRAEAAPPATEHAEISGEQMAPNRENVVMLHIDLPGDDPQAIDQIADVLARHPGPDEVLLHIVSGGREVTMQVGERFRVTAGQAVQAELDACFGREVARLEDVRPVAVDEALVAAVPAAQPAALPAAAGIEPAMAPTLVLAPKVGAPAADDEPRVTAGDQSLAVERTMVTTAAEWERVKTAILAEPVLGIDTEATGLDPFTSRLRLVQLAARNRVYVVDAFRLDPRTLQPILDEAQRLVGHNLTFDYRMLMAAGLRLPLDLGGRTSDTMLASQLLSAGYRDHRHRLADLVQRYLGVELDKTEQVSDWSGDLTDDQLAYAARDAAVLLPLRDRLRDELERADLGKVSLIESRALPAMAWLEQTGVPFDRTGWLALAEIAEKRRGRLERELDAMAPSDSPMLPLAGLEETSSRWNSPAQVLRLLEGRGLVLPDTRDGTLQEHRDDDPLIPLLLEHREAAKRCDAFGRDFLRFVHPVTGRVHADYFQSGTAAGRMASRHPNVQQMPRDPAYRACVRAPEGRILIKADYCLHPETEVETVGGVKRIADIVPGDKVYTLRDRSIAWGEVTRTVIVTGLPCYRLTFDNGESVIASSEHRWPVRVRGDKKRRSGHAFERIEKRTDDLVVGERLVPMRRVLSGGYVNLYAHAIVEYKQEHRLVADAVLGPCPPGKHVHHLNQDQTDNTPANLIYESSHDHGVYHGRQRWASMDAARRERIVAALCGGHRYRRSYVGQGNPNFGKLRGSALRCLRCDQTFYRPPSAVAKYCSRECYFEAQRAGLNHRLVAIEYVGPQPTVAITVEPDHNYVLACGVVTCNSQIELRIAAEVADDARLLDAYERGVDVHELTARQVLGHSTVTKADRQAAKSLNFGLLFGMGSARLRSYAKFAYGVDMTAEEAAAYRERFFETYVGLRRWHRSLPEGVIETRTLAGRRRLGIERFTEKANSPVQGAAADGLKLALGLLHETRNEVPSAALILAVHDEIVLECDEHDADRAREWLERCMREGMGELLKRVPVEVEGQIGRDWSMTQRPAEEAA